MDRKTKILIYMMLVGNFGILSTQQGIIGILPEISAFFNVSISQAGLFVSLFSLIIAITGIFLPLLSSKFNRKTMLIMVLSVFTVFTALEAFITDFYPALICRIIPAFFQTIYTSLTLTVASEIVGKEERHSAVSKVIMGVSAGMIVGMPITTFLTSMLGYQMALLWFSVINAVSLILTVIYFPSMPGKQQSYGSQISVAKTGLFIISVLGIVVLTSGSYEAYIYISQFLQEVTHINGFELSVVLFLYGIGSLIGNYTGGILLSKKAKSTVLSYPFVLTALFITIFILGGFKIPMIVLVFLWGLLIGVVVDILQYWVTTSAPEAPEFANGMFLSMNNIGITIGTSIGGVVVMSLGTKFIMIIGVVITLIGFVLLFTRAKKYPESVN